MVSYLIVGAGNFGASTALALKKRHEAVKVTLVDTACYPNPRAASHDVNKIVRDDYPDQLYMRMMQKAMPLWRNDDLYSRSYHEVGMLRADASHFGEESIRSYQKAGIRTDSEFLSIDEVRKRWPGAFATSNFGELEKVLYNSSVGYAEADKALEAVVQAAIEEGVKYVVDTVVKLTLSTEGNCTGIELQSGRTLEADKILLANGARMATLLFQSAPDNKLLHAGDRLKAVGAVSFKTKVSGPLRDRLARIPLFKNCLPEVKGEGMSMLKDGTLKFNLDLCFTNKQLTHEGGVMSVVPNKRELNEWTGPEFVPHFQKAARRALDGLYGEQVEDLTIESYRICWDGLTPDANFLITRHPHCSGLYLAGGGSFHGWKFLPIIGDYVADMMDDCLSEEHGERWAWGKKERNGLWANPTYEIIGDLVDFLHQATSMSPCHLPVKRRRSPTK